MKKKLSILYLYISQLARLGSNVDSVPIVRVADEIAGVGAGAGDIWKQNNRDGIFCKSFFYLMSLKAYNF